MTRFSASAVPASCLLLGLWLAGGPAFAQEAIQTGHGGAPPVASAAAGAEPDDVWARRVLDAASASASGAAPADGKAAATPACAAAKGDGKPHGEVWAGAGTRGYRQVGGVVTQPLGSCGSVTVMLDHTEGGYGAGRVR